MTHPTRGTLTRMFQSTVANHGPKAALKYKRDGVWHTITYDGYARYVRDFANGLMSLGVAPGDRVAIWSGNRPEWSIADFAVLHAGAVDAPIYPTLLPAQTEYIVKDSGAKVLIVEGGAKVDGAVDFLGKVPALKHVISMDPVPEGYKDKAEVLGFDDVYARGRAFAQEKPDEFDRRQRGIKPDDLATLIYTSGTTGTPKGVMLTQNNLYSNSVAASSPLEITKDDTHISFLPLCHSYERTAGHFVMVLHGATIGFAESLEKVPQNLQEIRPTIIQSVPRLYEKMFAGVHAKVAQAPPGKQRLFRWAVEVGMKKAALQQHGKGPGPVLAAQYAVADRLVLKKLRQALTGGNVRVMVTGAAALNPDVERFFDAIGLHILQGYGLTESSPVITVNRAHEYRYGSIGKPVPGVEVKLAEDGELLAHGPNIMQGYYNLPRETTEALTDDRWLRTGDIARVDDDGFYYITDRKKELFKTAYGKYIAPQPIENALKLDPFVGTPIVLGAEKKYAAVLIVPNWEALEPWAKKEGIAAADRTALVADPKVRARYQQTVDKVNEGLAQYEKVKNFALLDRDLSMDNGELTPTLKVKRRVVMDSFRPQIDGLFRE